MTEVTTEPINKKPESKVDKYLLMGLALLLTAVIVGGVVWYVKDVEAKRQKQESAVSSVSQMMADYCTVSEKPTDEELILNAKEVGFDSAKVEIKDGKKYLTINYKTVDYFWRNTMQDASYLMKCTADETSSTETTDETSNWKTYTDHDQRFTIKYPSDWSYQADVESGTDGSLNSNVFAADNVLFYDTAKTMVFGFNMGEVYGRGGVCTKRQVLYGSTVTANKLVLTKKGDTTKAVSTDEYCGVGETLTGYQTTIELFTEGGNEYFIHSEMVGATDTVATKAIEIFEKMAATMTFK